jgi:hypothetical protein
MQKDQLQLADLKESALTEILSVFRNVITSLMKKRGRTIRRVIFSKNTEGNLKNLYRIRRNNSELFK